LLRANERKALRLSMNRFQLSGDFQSIEERERS
jgi:hypothetical protein